MKTEREKGIYSEHEHDDHSEHDDSVSRRDSGESTRTMSAKSEDLATPLTTPSSSPPQKALFLPSEVSQTPILPLYPESNLSFYQAYYDRQTTNPVLSVQTNAPYMYDDLSLSWLDSVAVDEAYNLSLQNNDDFSLMNL